MRNMYLLGATQNKTIIFGEFEITTRNGFNEFTASFCEVMPFDADDFDILSYFEDEQASFESYAEGKAYLYDECDRLGCSPCELPSVWADRIDDVRDIIDCSYYNKMFEINGTNYCFESYGGGQLDTRGKMEKYTNKFLYDKLHYFWDNYHLKEVDEETIASIENMKQDFETINTAEWIKNYIANNF